MDYELRPELKVGDEVYAKHKNGRYYLGTLKSLSDVLYYCVIFDDGTMSRDLYPDDIIVRHRYLTSTWLFDITYDAAHKVKDIMVIFVTIIEFQVEGWGSSTRQLCSRYLAWQ